MDMKEHVTVVGALCIGLGALGVVLAIIVFVVLAGVGVLSGDREALPILTFIAVVSAGFLAIISVPDIIGGIGLLRRQPWARILVLILSVIKLINFPLGTIVGIYSIWVLMQNEVVELFARGSGS
jgi:hypothetical protein